MTYLRLSLILEPFRLHMQRPSPALTRPVKPNTWTCQRESLKQQQEVDVLLSALEEGKEIQP